MAGVLMDFASNLAKRVKQELAEAKAAYKDFVDSIVRDNNRLNNSANNTNINPGSPSGNGSGNGGGGGSNGSGGGGGGGPRNPNPTNMFDAAARRNQRQRNQNDIPMLRYMRNDPNFRGAVNDVWTNGSPSQRSRISSAFRNKDIARQVLRDYRAGRLIPRPTPTPGNNGGSGGGGGGGGSNPPPGVPGAGSGGAGGKGWFGGLFGRFNLGGMAGKAALAGGAALAAFAGAVYILKQAADILLKAGDMLYNVTKEILKVGINRERQLWAMQVPFGNLGNAAQAISFVRQLGKAGIPLRQDDMIKGFQGLMEAGIDPTKKKNFDLFANIAGRSGKGLEQVAQDFSSAAYGDSGVLRQYGFSNQQIFRLDRMADQRPNARRDVLLSMFQNDKRWKNGLKDFENTFDGMVNKLSNIWTNFVEQIVGDPSDPSSLYNKFKEVLGNVVKWFQDNQQRITRIAKLIGAGLKWMLTQVGNFFDYVTKKLEPFLSKLDGSEEKFQQTIGKFVLWLELTKIKFLRFWDDWIKPVLKFSVVVGKALWSLGKIVGTFIQRTPAFKVTALIWEGLAWALDKMVWALEKILPLFDRLANKFSSFLDPISKKLGIPIPQLIVGNGIIGAVLWGKKKVDDAISDIVRTGNGITANWAEEQRNPEAIALMDRFTGGALTRAGANKSPQLNPTATQLMDNVTGGAYSRALKGAGVNTGYRPSVLTDKGAGVNGNTRIDRQINYGGVNYNITVSPGNFPSTMKEIRSFEEERAAASGYPSAAPIDPYNTGNKR